MDNKEQKYVDSLFEWYKTGDIGIYTFLYDIYSPKSLDTIKKIIGNNYRNIEGLDDPENINQDFWVAIFNKEILVHNLSVNVKAFVNKHTKKALAKKRGGDLYRVNVDELANVLPSDTLQPGEWVATNASVELVQNYICSLTGNRHYVAWMYFICQECPEHIAEVRNMSVSRVYQIIMEEKDNIKAYITK